MKRKISLDEIALYKKILFKKATNFQVALETDRSNLVLRSGLRELMEAVLDLDNIVEVNEVDAIPRDAVMAVLPPFMLDFQPPSGDEVAEKCYRMV